MAQKRYKGKLIRIIIDDKKILHATEGSISISVAMEELATKDTNGTISTPSGYSWSATCNAVVAEPDTGDTAHQSMLDVIDTMLDLAEVDFQFTTDETGDFIFSGKAYVTQADITAATENAATGTLSFTGNGDLTKAVVAA